MEADLRHQRVELVTCRFAHDDEVHVRRLVETTRVQARARASGDDGSHAAAEQDAADLGDHGAKRRGSVEFHSGLPESRGRLLRLSLRCPRARSDLARRAR